MAVSIVGGDFSIVACSARGSRLIAAKVSAMLLNSSACTRATGATWAEVRPSWRKNWSSWVSGSLRLVITGVQALEERVERLDRGVQRAAAAGERVAEALQRRARVVARGLVEGGEARPRARAPRWRCAAASCRPRCRWTCRLPGVSSTYFRPSAERGRTLIVVSVASGSTVLSSFMAMHRDRLALAVLLARPSA